jgi:ABC-type uncharacterized transport system involved in gliding motility auxiliary subunit
MISVQALMFMPIIMVIVGTGTFLIIMKIVLALTLHSIYILSPPKLKKW